MNRTEKFAIKYLIIGFTIGLLKALILGFVAPIIFKFELEDPLKAQEILFESLSYLSNVVVGLFILYDSLKFLKNKIAISILGFCIPIFGICFLIIENFLIEKTIDNDR